MDLTKTPTKSVDVDGTTHKIPDRGLQEWEVDLLSRLRESWNETPQKSFWVRGWLNNNGPDYSRSIHKNWVTFVTHPTSLRLLESEVCICRPGQPDATRRILYLLKEAGAIEVVGQEKVDGVPVKRNYYAISDAMHDCWLGPYNYNYGNS